MSSIFRLVRTSGISFFAFFFGLVSFLFLDQGCISFVFVSVGNRAEGGSLPAQATTYSTVVRHVTARAQKPHKLRLPATSLCSARQQHGRLRPPRFAPFFFFPSPRSLVVATRLPRWPWLPGNQCVCVSASLGPLSACLPACLSVCLSVCVCVSDCASRFSPSPLRLTH